MATKITVNGRTTRLADVFAQITSGITNNPSPLDFGNILIIDDGMGAGFSEAVGVNGTSLQGVNSVYNFTSTPGMRSLLRDGELYQVADPLFQPAEKGVPGANKVSYLKAAVTAPGTASLSFAKSTLSLITSGEGPAVNGSLVMKTYTTLNAPGSITGTPHTTGGSQADGTRYYVVHAKNGNGITIASSEVSVTVAGGGGSGSSTIGWAAVSGATGYRIFRGSTSGTEDHYFDVGAVTSFTDTGAAGTAGTPPTQNSATVATANDLFKGYGVRLEKGRAYGYSLVFYRGVNCSSDSLNPNTTYDGTIVSPSTTQGVNSSYNAPATLFRSPDLYNMRSLQKWLSKSPDVKKYFGTNVAVVYTGTSEFDDAFVTGDINQYTALAPFSLVSGATETYDESSFQQALVIAKSVDNTFYLSTNYGSDAKVAHNTAIQDLILSGQMKYEKYEVVGGGFDGTEFALGVDGGSIDIAQFFDSSSVIVVHGGGKIVDPLQPTGFRTISQFYKAAMVLGRICGLEPQASVTMKSIGLAAEIHTLTDGDSSEKEAAVEYGVLYTNYDQELNAFVVGFGINTMQDADFLVDGNADSYDIAVERIKSQLNKELVYAAKKRFFGNKTKGANRNTVSVEDVTAWLSSFLDSRVATAQQDNYLLRWDTIACTFNQDNLYVTFNFVPNYPVNRIIFNGVMLAS